MTLSANDQAQVAKLGNALQKLSALNFERLVAGLLGHLLGVGVAVAKGSFQHGGDAGTAGRQGRQLRIECKKYANTTPLSDRELLGEVDQALDRDPALEAWILIATREVSEQLEDMLFQKALKTGVPIIIIDWKGDGLSSLAALCAFAPDIVGEFSTEAGVLANALQRLAGDAVAQLRISLRTWSLGFEAVRTLSQDQLKKIWTLPRSSAAALNQNAAGDATSKRIARPSVSANLDTWWSGAATSDAPAAVFGADGVGKTWGTLAWLIDRVDVQPIVLVIASSTATELTSTSEVAIKRFLAARLHELSDGVRDLAHWQRRLDRLLKRPIDEGPVLTVFFDGLNQEPSAPWIALLKTLQDDPFAGLVRVIISTRRFHFEDKLGQLRGLIVAPTLVQVGVYDDTPGGELDQRLALEGLIRADLHPGLIELARTPRLFDLVVRLKDRLVQTEKITIHRLLWEYGRDALGERAGRSFSEDDWRAWLREIANRYRNGVRNFSLKTLGETASRADLSNSEVFARLSDIIDGQFTVPDTAGFHRLKPDVVAHALGAGLLAQLTERDAESFDILESELGQWLDPIAGLDQRAEILRAAVSILVEQGLGTDTPLAGVLVTAWLQTQNFTDIHRQELTGLAVRLLDALLDAIEHSPGYVHFSARLLAVNALRAIPREPGAAFERIVLRSRRWLSVVSRHVQPAHPGSDDYDRNRARRFVERIGADVSGPRRVVGVDLLLVDQTDDAVAQTVPSLLEGYPLAGVMPVFEAAAVALAVGGGNPAWDSLQWLCLLNEIDPSETAAALRTLLTEIRARPAEQGVHPALSARAAALLLWLTGDEADEIEAVAGDPGLDRMLSYEDHYLPDPARSLLPLERRHAEAVLRDTSMPLLLRVKRTRELWLDPTFEAPAELVSEAIAAADSFDVTILDRHRDRTIEDHHFEVFQMVLARCAPERLVNIIRAELRESNVPADARYWRAIHAAEHLILGGPQESTAARALRLSSHEKDRPSETYASTQLLLLELHREEAFRQVEILMEADLDDIFLELTDILKPITKAEGETLVARFGDGSVAQKRNLISLLWATNVETTEALWTWLLAVVDGPETELHGVAYRALTAADGAKFGRDLLARNWSWSPTHDHWVNHYGTEAIIKATAATPFDQVVSRLAPWRLLEAARERGADPSEVRLAATILSSVLGADKLEAPDPGARLSLDRTDDEAGPNHVSVTPFDLPRDPADPSSNMRRLMEPEEHLQVGRRAFETAIARIRQARASGASLYLAELDPEDMAPVLRYAPEQIELWLEDAADGASDFRRRVMLAEGVYMALCEALLDQDPDCGALLWKALRTTLTTRFIGTADVGEMIHMIFRAPTSQAVITLRRFLFGLESSNTDKDLLNLAISASLNGQGEWLDSVIREDVTSNFAWRRKRGLVLVGFKADNSLPQLGAWPDEPVQTAYDNLRWRSARFRYLEACAHHWWRSYLSAPDPEAAYAAWILFVRAADQRAWVWIKRDADAAKTNDEFYRLKMSHAQVNTHGLKQRMKKREDNLEKDFLNRAVQYDIGPWRKISH